MAAYQIDGLIRMALQEDIGSGDRTTGALIAPDQRGCARVIAKQGLVVAGTEPFLRVFQLLDGSIRLGHLVPDGTALEAGACVAELQGTCATLLSGERTALNFLQRLSGIATLTRAYVDRIAACPATVLDTRKTTPGWRVLEKAAVRAGGGRNHRMGLFDAVLIKENHIEAAGGITAAVDRARKACAPHAVVEVEVRSPDEFREALAAGPDMILLDNMSCDQMRQAVRDAGGRVPLEASGNIDLDTIETVAATGIDYISVGALTHSAPAADVSMLIQQVR